MRGLLVHHDRGADGDPASEKAVRNEQIDRGV